MKLQDGDMGKKPFKLEDFDKRSVYTVPDGYFDHLPTRISERVVQPKKTFFSFGFAQSLKYALPVVLLLVVAAAIFFNKSGTEVLSAEALLAQVSDQDLIEYLEQTDITADEVLEEIAFFDELDIESIDMEEIEESILESEDLLELYQEFESTGEYL